MDSLKAFIPEHKVWAGKYEGQAVTHAVDFPFRVIKKAIGHTAPIDMVPVQSLE